MGHRTQPPACTCKGRCTCGYGAAIAAAAYGQGHGPSTRPDRVKATIAAINAQTSRKGR
nr:hypothetical protein [Micromonospora sp. DSM 115978]